MYSVVLASLFCTSKNQSLNFSISSRMSIPVSRSTSFTLVRVPESCSLRFAISLSVVGVKEESFGFCPSMRSHIWRLFWI